MDINDRDSIARFQDGRRREIERLASVERHIAGLVNVASMIGLSALYIALLVIFLNVVMIVLLAS